MYTIEIYEWTTIDAFDIRSDYYEISRHGDVKIKHTGRIMKPYEFKAKSSMYMRIGLLTNSGKTKQFFIHRLVAAHFCGRPKGYTQLQVNHIDGDTRNNYSFNLEWCTGSQNMKHAYACGLAVTRGEQCHLTKFSDEQVHHICELLERGYSPKAIIKTLNLLDLNTVTYKSKEYERMRGYIKKLRTRTFRKDIVLLYDF